MRTIPARLPATPAANNDSVRCDGPTFDLDFGGSARGLGLIAATLAVVLVFPTVLVAPAFASDGVLEINQTCAVHTGCFAGDTAGLPVTISASGSYLLTSNLVVPNENTDGIVISTNNVGIDLNDFEISGPVGCSGTPLACAPAAGTGSGVERTSNLLSGLSVRNGSIRGMGSHGVLLARQSEVHNLRVRENRVDGIQVADGSIVTGNTADLNGDDGIDTVFGEGSTVSGNTVHQNGDDGITASFGSIVSENVAHLNGDDGIGTESGSTLSGNASYLNGGDGIRGSFGSTVSDNTAYKNGGDGIRTDSGCTVTGNTLRDNTGLGLWAGLQTGYRDNVISANSGGTVFAGVDAGNNVCDGSLTCP